MSNAEEFAFIEGLANELSSKELVFPTSLNATMKIRHALIDPDIPTDKAARVVGAEPVVTAHILKAGNSAAFSHGAGAVSDLRKAILRLGISTVRNIAISVGMKQLMQQKAAAEVPKMIEDLWKRCLRISALSFVIAKRLTKVDPETAMMAGLLLHIGKFYIINRAHDYKDLITDEASLWALVEQWDANIGTAILESWEMPVEIRTAVLDGGDPDHAHRGPANLTDVVAAAGFLDDKFYSSEEVNLDWSAVPHTLVALDLDKDKSVALMEDTREELALIFQALS